MMAWAQVFAATAIALQQLSTPSGVVATETIPAFSPGKVEWQGRVAVSANGSVSFDWLGSQFAVTVQGSSLFATFDAKSLKPGGHVKLRVFVTKPQHHPGHAPPIPRLGLYPLPHAEVVLNPSVSTYVLASGLSRGATVWVYNNQSPSYMGRSLSMVSLSTDGTFAAPQIQPTVASRRIEFVGDSITAATNLRRPSGDPAFGIPQAPTCGDAGLYSDYPLSYMALLCQAFGANCSTIAWGGKGMYKNCCDKGTTMPEYFRQRLAFEGSAASQPYQFAGSGFAPDAIVINLGTNDYSHCRNRPGGECEAGFAAAFTKTYVDFMHNATKWYRKPNIEFFCGVGPITINYWPAVVAAVTQAKAEGLSATLIDMQACNNMTGQPLTNMSGNCQGCATHPGILGHRRMYELSYPTIKSTLGW